MATTISEPGGAYRAGPAAAPPDADRAAPAPRRAEGGAWAVALAVALLSLWTVYLQEQEYGLQYLRTRSMAEHTAVLGNTAPNPWQYRVATVWLIEALFRAAAALGVPDHQVVVMLAVRLGQNVLIFGLAAAYYARLGLERRAVLLGLGVLGWSMSYMLFNSGLTFSTYSDGVFYLAGALAIVSGHYLLLLVLMPLAALNRETSALLPAMLVCHAAYAEGSWRAVPRTRAFRIAVALGAIWLAAFVGLRAYYGLRSWGTWGLPAPGVPMLTLNLRDPLMWRFAVGTFGVLPLVVLLGARRVPPAVRAFALALVPVWMLVHFATVLANETRIFLVPVAVVLVPAALFAVVGRAPGEPARGAA